MPMQSELVDRKRLGESLAEDELDELEVLETGEEEKLGDNQPSDDSSVGEDKSPGDDGAPSEDPAAAARADESPLE